MNFELQFKVVASGKTVFLGGIHKKTVLNLFQIFKRNERYNKPKIDIYIYIYIYVRVCVTMVLECNCYPKFHQENVMKNEWSILSKTCAYTQSFSYKITYSLFSGNMIFD